MKIVLQSRKLVCKDTQKYVMLENRYKNVSPEKIDYNDSVYEDDISHESLLVESKKIISTLNDSDEEIILKHYFERLSLKSITNKMKVSSGMVQKSHYRILQKVTDRIPAFKK